MNKKTINSPKELRAELQKLAQSIDKDVSLTQGAAEELSKHALVKITKERRRSNYSKALIDAKNAMDKLSNQFSQLVNNKDGQLDKRLMDELIEKRSFCGISPWC